jgi:predicted AAA+ superfamily ATPase
MELTFAKKVNIWQEVTFQEIIASHNTHWILQMPRRHGKTRLLRRLAEHYIAEGKDVYVMTDSQNNTFNDINIKWAGQFDEESTNVVFIIDGIHKREMHYQVIKKGGMIVNAYTKTWESDYQQKDREYRVLTL